MEDVPKMYLPYEQIMMRNLCSSMLFYCKMIFFYFVMKAPKGSKMPRGDKTHILSYPCYDIQNKKNGALFSSLDCKIALNRAINRNLEALARQVYDYWFVQFEFSDAHGKPYKSSGGKMLYSEKHSDTHPELVYADECPELWQQHPELAEVKSLF